VPDATERPGPEVPKVLAGPEPEERPALAGPSASDGAASTPGGRALEDTKRADTVIEPNLGAAPGATKRKPLGRRVAGLVVSLGLILVIFLGVIPQFANYSEAWTAIQKMSAGWWVALGTATVVNQLAFVLPYQAVLPHLRYGHGFMETQTTSAISNTVPAGGAVAIGMTFKMFGSYGFSSVAISTAVVTTGIWIMAFKLGLPIVAVVLVGVTGQDTAGVVGAAVLGLVVIIVLGLLLWLVFRSPTSALRIGRLGDSAVNWALHFAHKPKSDRVQQGVLHFRDQTNEIVRERGRRLTLAVLLSQCLVLVLVFFCTRSVGITAGQVSGLEVLLAIAVARLVGVIPLTPGGLGTIDAAFIGMLSAFGANSSVALAADMMWRVTTYFPPIFVGVITYFLWKRGMAKGMFANHPDAQPAPAYSGPSA
jgi:putative heme transporter